VIIILIGLFTFQQFGTKVIGGIFGPVMMIWFLMIGGLGLLQIAKNPTVLEAVNPIYAFNLIANYPGGFWLLGAVFLCTTGGEALYSDLGHCGKRNIRVSWSFVIVMLMLSYFGQASYILQYQGQVRHDKSPFYSLMPSWFLPVGITVATLATIIASQALISGAYTLVNEAMKLRLWPNLKVMYPTVNMGQIYIPFINWFLFAGCVAAVLVFEKASNMEAAYGLAIIVDMLMTTLLLCYYLYTKSRNVVLVLMLAVFSFNLLGDALRDLLDPRRRT
jgi:KUP system potassium uptake protein